MPAVHRSGDPTVAVTSGGVPRASTRVRDALARRLDHRYAVAIAGLIRLRQRLLAADDRVAWQSAASTLLADDFCESVESGEFLERLGNMAIVVAGISHQGAALAVREKIAYRATELLPTLAALRDASRLREGVLLSTCNRTEFYIVESEHDAAPDVWRVAHGAARRGSVARTATCARS